MGKKGEEMIAFSFFKDGTAALTRCATAEEAAKEAEQDSGEADYLVCYVALQPNENQEAACQALEAITLMDINNPKSEYYIEKLMALVFQEGIKLGRSQA